MFGIAGLLADAGMSLVSAFIDKGKERAVDLIKEKTGIDLAEKKELTHEEIERLQEFETKNKELLLQQIELFLKDRQDARAMQQSALAQESWFAKNFINLFAMFWSVVASLYIYLVTFTQFPTQNQRFADTVLGFVLGTIIASIIGFYYGSSIGSKNKEALLKGRE